MTRPEESRHRVGPASEASGIVEVALKPRASEAAEPDTTQAEAAWQNQADAPDSLRVIVSRLDRLWRRDAYATGASDGAPQPDTPTDGAGAEQIGRFRIRREIGRGGFGIVLLADDPQLRREVAVKIPRPEVMVVPDILERFAREAVAAASLEHRYIAQVFEANLEAASPYIVSAYCEGSDLGRWLAERDRPIAPGEAVALAIQLAEALVYAHDCGVFHRDIKPGNVLLQPITEGGDRTTSLADFEPRLTDFGLAKLTSPEFLDTRSSLLIGTPLYMAPEQLEHGPSPRDAASDVYSLGVLLFELLTLRLPLEGAGYADVLDKIRHAEPAHLRDLIPELPADLGTICEKCLAKSVQDRYASMQHLLNDLRRFERGEPIHARPTRWWHRLERWRRKPERLTTAGSFSFYFQWSIVTWCCLNFVAVWILQVHSDEVLYRSVLDIVLVSPTSHLPKAWLAAKTVSGSRWAYWAATITSAALLIAFLHSTFFESKLFEYNYPTVHSRITTHMALSVAGAIELGLFLLAAPAAKQPSRTTYAVGSSR